MAGVSPTQNTLKKYRKEGYEVGICEYWNSFTRTRKDLFGFLDCIALGEGETIGIQATSRTNISARVKKIKTERAKPARRWLNAGNKIHVIGWGKKKNRWEAKTIELTLADLPEGEEDGTD